MGEVAGTDGPSHERPQDEPPGAVPLTGLALFRAYHLLLNEPIGFGRTLYVEDAIFLSRERMIVN